MDVSTSTFSFTQTLLAWTLLGLLLFWLITFAVLALRSLTPEKGELEDLPTPAESFPAVSTHTHAQYAGTVLVSTHLPAGVSTKDTSSTFTHAEVSQEVGSAPIV
jgi:hypothetical protein